MGYRLAMCGLLVCAAVVAPSAEAQKVELTPHVGYRLGGELNDYLTGRTYDFSDSESYGLTLDYTLGLMGDTQLELAWSRQETDVDIGTSSPEIFDLTIDYWHVGGLKQWSEDEPVRPFAVVTLGATHVSPDQGDSSSDTRFSFGLGGGVKILPGQHIGIRIQGRLYGTYASGGAAAICGPVGCSFGFSGNFLWQLEFTAGLILAFGDA